MWREAPNFFPAPGLPEAASGVEGSTVSCAVAQHLQNSSVHVLRADQVIWILMGMIKIRTVHLAEIFPPYVFSETFFFKEAKQRYL